MLFAILGKEDLEQINDLGVAKRFSQPPGVESVQPNPAFFKALNDLFKDLLIHQPEGVFAVNFLPLAPMVTHDALQITQVRKFI